LEIVALAIDLAVENAIEERKRAGLARHRPVRPLDTRHPGNRVYLGELAHEHELLHVVAVLVRIGAHDAEALEARGVLALERMLDRAHLPLARPVARPALEQQGEHPLL